MKRSVLLLAGAVVGLTACDSFREAMTAHVDTAARAGSQELSVQQLADMLGEAPMPLNKDVAKTVAQVWVDYQLLAQAAANNDSLSDSTLVANAMWSQYASMKMNAYMQGVAKDWVKAPTPPTEAEYAQGDVLAAKHILLRFPEPNPSEAVRDSVLKVAQSVRAQATPANFGQLAQRYSADSGSAVQGGDVGVFQPQMMVPEFARAVAALQPGQISQPVMTQFGYHIIMRTPYGEVNKEQYAAMATQHRAAAAESTYRAGLETSNALNIRPNIAETVKKVAADPDAYRKDGTVLATWKKGEFTAGRLAQYIQASPPQQQARQQIASLPDSVMPEVVRSFAYRELVLAAADSAKAPVDTTQVGELHRAFVSAVTGAWTGLGVAPASFPDSLKTAEARERVAAERVNQYFDQLLKNQAQFVQVPPPIENALRDKFEYKVNEAGLDRALELAAAIRTRADSARAAQQPPTAVPMPGAAPAGPPAPGQTPPPQQ